MTERSMVELRGRATISFKSANVPTISTGRRYLMMFMNRSSSMFVWSATADAMARDAILSGVTKEALQARIGCCAFI